MDLSCRDEQEASSYITSGSIGANLFMKMENGAGTKSSLRKVLHPKKKSSERRKRCRLINWNAAVPLCFVDYLLAWRLDPTLLRLALPRLGNTIRLISISSGACLIGNQCQSHQRSLKSRRARGLIICYQEYHRCASL